MIDATRGKTCGVASRDAARSVCAVDPCSNRVPAMRFFILLSALCLALPLHAQQPVRIFAAASLTNALDEIAAAWERQQHPRPSIAYAGSSALAKQIEAGAPTDLFVSADTSWMDRLEQAGKLQAGTRVDLLGNALVLIAPIDRPIAVGMDPAFDLAAAFDGKLCTGEPGVVPVGIYAQEALQHLGWWDALRGRIVGTEDVRGALSFVERGECALGIVYATDAAISARVAVLARFPADSHRPIVYPVALVRGARPEAAAFLAFLRDSPAANEVFARFGFLRPAP
jgi:molybdate transport system substrate-binding protein